MGDQKRGAVIVGLKEEDVYKRRNHGPYSGSGSYNSVPVVLHCNCFVLFRVY
jgi:hypothetical protein